MQYFFFLSFFFFFFRIYVWLLPYIPCELRDRVGGRMAGLLDIRCLYLFFSLVLCRLDRAQHRTHIPFPVYEATGQFSSSVQLNRSTRTVALATRLKKKKKRERLALLWPSVPYSFKSRSRCEHIKKTKQITNFVDSVSARSVCLAINYKIKFLKTNKQKQKSELKLYGGYFALGIVYRT